jgi:type I restriction enzyme M protein
METSAAQKGQQSQLHTRLWSIANDLRGSMDASEFRNYILGLIFYRYLSERVENRAAELLASDNTSYAKAWSKPEYRQAIIEELIELIGYVIEPEYLFSSLVGKIEDGTFDVEVLQTAVNNLTDSTIGQPSQRDFENLFDDMDLNSNKLGKTVRERSTLIAKVISNIDQIDFGVAERQIDVLGDAYEYLIGQFAANAGKKAGEFYTPQQVSKLIAKIVTLGKKKIRDVYDPTCGSGSLLLRVAHEANIGSYFGQEKVSTTYNLARMNMLLHSVSYTKFDIVNDDTLENPAFDGRTFEAVVANPPYSANWSADPKFLDDERFSAAGKLAPKSKADYAFVEHMLYHLDDGGTMAVVLPHGVLFRGASEGAIRQWIVKDMNWLDTVIGLPANIFFGTSIPTIVLVFKKCRENSEDVLFIDASQAFKKGKNQNILRDEDVERILNAYIKREDIERFAHVAPLDEIAENDYNLNIPRYVDTFEEEEPIDIETVMAEIKKIDVEMKQVDEELNVCLRELGLPEF